MSSTAAFWGDRIAVEEIGGVPFRMYAERPRRVETLLDFSARWGSRIHIVHGNEEVSFEALHRRVAGKARQLSGLGIQPGEHILLLGWNSPDWVANFWACLAVGAVPVLGNGWWSETELGDALALVAPALTLADAHGAAKMPGGWRLGPWETDAQAEAGGDVVPVSRDENAPAVIIFTSGTEGRAKAVVLAHRSLLSGLQMLLHVTKRLPHQLDGVPRDIGLHTGPLFHIGGVQTLLRAIVIGGTLVMPRGKFDPADALELIERYGVTRWSAVPTMVSRLLEHPDVHRRRLDTLRSLTVGGAPVHSELLKKIRNGLPGLQPKIATGYGLSENGGQATAASGVDTAERPGSSGKPLPCVEVSIEPIPGWGDDGEIHLRSPTQMLGYYGPGKSPIDAQGWLHTGDLGHLDDGGHLWITGRSKEVIIRGGENISPVAVERALASVPGVADAVVFGVPNPDLGEEVMAVVVVRAALTADQLQAQLRGKLASFSVPSRWRIQTEALPTNHAGKIDKALLVGEERALRAAELARAEA